MADDQSRPSENEHQDAESEADEARRASDDPAPTARDDAVSENDGEGGSASNPDREGHRTPADPESDAPDGDDGESDEAETLDASETPATRETTDADDAADAEETAGTDETAEADDLTAESSSTDEVGADEEDVNGEDADAPESGRTADDDAESDDPDARQTVPDDVRKYERFKKMDGAQYDRVNEFLRERTYITAREWAIARLCADFRTETGVEMTKIGENLPELVPFMTDTYTPQAVNQARSSFENKVRQAGATFLYGAMSGFFTAEELDDMMYEVTEVAKFLLEVEGVDLSVDEELEAEDRISGVMREVQSASEQLRHDEMECPNCGHEMEEADDATPSDD